MLEVKSQIKPALESRFALSTTWTLGKIIVAAAGALMLAGSAWRTASSMKRETQPARAVRKEPSILIGSR